MGESGSRDSHEIRDADGASRRDTAPVEPGTVRYFVTAVLFAALYVVLARLGLRLNAVSEFATLVWAPTGVSLAVILLLGYRFWPSIAVGAFLANLWTGAPLLAALGIGAGNTIEALAGAWALRRIPGFRRSLDRLPDVVGLMLIAGIAASAISASTGVASLSAAGLVAEGRLWQTWRAWWLGDAIGAIIVAPLILTWRSPRDVSRRPGRLAEGALLSALLVVSSYYIFERTKEGMAALLSPLLVWAAIRFEQRGAARAAFLVSVVAVWSTVRLHGPFLRDSVAESLFALQAFMALTSATFLVLGAITAERRRAREEAEAASRAKDQFLAALSHELRTPLTPVLALASALERQKGLPEETRRQIEVVRRNAQLEARLIDDLLDVTRIERGKLQLQLEPVELSRALDQAVEVCRDEAAAKGIVLEREGPGGGMTVRADPARLQQVLRNIIKNAIQFSTRGGRVRLRSLPLGPGRIAVEVSDSGSGIEASDLRRIFLPFEQVGRGSRGLGLGLAISRALVEAQGGTLTAASDGAGRGATFRVVLQETRDDAPSAIRAGAEIPPPAEPPAPRRVLLVEDHADTANALRELLQELSCEVVAAGTVRDALAAAEAGSFDLVLSDLGLPDGSGLDLMRRLRDGHGLSGIAVSGYGMQEDLRRSLEAGFVEHLVKPVTFERLADAVDRFFAYRSAAGVSA